MRTVSLRHVCSEDLAVMDYTETGMVIGKMEHYQVVAMRRKSVPRCVFHVGLCV